MSGGTVLEVAEIAKMEVAFHSRRDLLMVAEDGKRKGLFFLFKILEGNLVFVSKGCLSQNLQRDDIGIFHSDLDFKHGFGQLNHFLEVD